MANTFAEFQILGHVGSVKRVGATLRISVAAEYGRKDDDGKFQSKPFWNQVVIFKEARFKWLEANIGPGDLVLARGTLRDTNYDKGGVKVYTTTLDADEFELLAKRPEAPADA